MVHHAEWHVHGMGREGLEIEDLVQTGVMALTECARRHAGPREDGSAAFAKIRVRGAMLDHIRRQLNDTRNAKKRRAAYERALERLRIETGRKPSRAEIAAALHISDGELLQIEASAVTVSLISEEDDDSNTAFASEDPDLFEALCASEDRERLAEALGELPDRLKLVLQLFCVEELNLTEIAAVLYVSVPRVHQLRAKALKDLKAMMEAND